MRTFWIFLCFKKGYAWRGQQTNARQWLVLIRRNMVPTCFSWSSYWYLRAQWNQLRAATSNIKASCTSENLRKDLRTVFSFKPAVTGRLLIPVQSATVSGHLSNKFFHFSREHETENNFPFTSDPGPQNSPNKVNLYSVQQSEKPVPQKHSDRVLLTWNYYAITVLFRVETLIDGQMSYWLKLFAQAYVRILPIFFTFTGRKMTIF